MYSKVFTFAALVAAAVIPRCTTASLPHITAVGSKFFDSNGNQFFMKGVAYQLTSLDPLLDTQQCTRDAKQMKDLGANTIRVYHVDPTQDHTGCMSAFADQGIYLFVDLDTFSSQIDPNNTAWTQSQLTAFNNVLDEFQKYDNTAGVFVGNEVLTQANASVVAPYVKAAVRDVKAYRDSKNYRKIPIGYSAADIPELRPMLQNYMACGSAPDISDFFSLNVYEWCGDSSYDGSGYSLLEQNATNLNIPIFISETGCNKPMPRLFADQASIFGQNMSNTWSGAIVYEWIEEANSYGLVSYGPKVDATTATAALDGYPRSGTPTPVSPDYSNLKAQWATLSPSGVKLSAYSASATAITPVACPSSTASGWAVNPSAPLPSLGQTLNLADVSASSTATGTATGSAASANPTKGAAPASGGIEVGGVVLGLVGVMVGGIVWL